jgi:membrane-associated phospholipid phosphatase
VTLRPVDRVILVYIAVVTVVALVRVPVAPGAVWVVGANALVVALIILVNRPGLGRVGRGLADIYPLLILLALYGALDLLAGYGGVATHDTTVQRWEAAVFGGQLSREWWQRSPSAFWSTVLHAVYFSYYLVVPAGPLYFLWKGDRKNLRRVVLAEVVTFTVCYLVFIFFPVAGPYYEFPRPSAAFLDNRAARLVYGVLSGGSAYGAAFPSSHVAGMITATVMSAKGSRRLGLILGIPTVLLTVGVVYCQMHYGVDVLAGVLVAAVVIVWVSGKRELRSTDYTDDSD